MRTSVYPTIQSPMLPPPPPLHLTPQTPYITVHFLTTPVWSGHLMLIMAVNAGGGEAVSPASSATLDTAGTGCTTASLVPSLPACPDGEGSARLLICAVVLFLLQVRDAARVITWCTENGGRAGEGGGWGVANMERESFVCE